MAPGAASAVQALLMSTRGSQSFSAAPLLDCIMIDQGKRESWRATAQVTRPARKGAIKENPDTRGLSAGIGRARSETRQTGPGDSSGFASLQQACVRQWHPNRKDQTADRCCRGPCNSLPLVHTRSCPSRVAQNASAEETMEAIWIGCEMRAGGAYAHFTLALDTVNEVLSKHCQC